MNIISKIHKTSSAFLAMFYRQERVIVYIDGYSLYHGLKSKYKRKYLWLNIESLSRKILKSHQKLVRVKYFTSKISSPTESVKRQNQYLKAVAELDCVQIFYGRYQLQKIRCQVCNDYFKISKEKKTDVNIATEMIRDAFVNCFDTAILISGDSDLVPVVQSIANEANKTVICAFPPERCSKELQQHSSGYFTIGQAIYRNSLFSNPYRTKTDFLLHKPKEWQ